MKKKNKIKKILLGQISVVDILNLEKKLLIVNIVFFVKNSIEVSGFNYLPLHYYIKKQKILTVITIQQK